MSRPIQASLYADDELAIPPFRPRSGPPPNDVATDSRPSSAVPSPKRKPRSPKQQSQVPDHNKPESRLGQYRIIKTVGEGSFGKVKLAIHKVTGQRVALKMISRKNLTSRDMAGRVEREISYLQLLRHPHIIKL